MGGGGEGRTREAVDGRRDAEGGSGGGKQTQGKRGAWSDSSCEMEQVESETLPVHRVLLPSERTSPESAEVKKVSAGLDLRQKCVPMLASSVAQRGGSSGVTVVAMWQRWCEGGAETGERDG